MDMDMEEPITAASSANIKTKLRYPLRSATTKSKEQTSRPKPMSTVSQSVGLLDVSVKERSAKPPTRRLSTPAKSKQAGNVTPIPEARTRRTNNNDQGKTPTRTLASSLSSLAMRKKFNHLSSASYWLSQIQYSESAAKHSISLGFFKLALEARCEPLQQMRDELKSYARRHDLGESVKELFESYNICENQEQVQVSETCSQVPEEETRSSDEEVRSTSSTVGTIGSLKPKSLNTEAAQVSSVIVSTKKEISLKNKPTPRTKAVTNKKPAETKLALETRARKLQNKPQPPSKLDSSKDKGNAKKQAKKSANDKGPVSTSPATDKVEEEKENMGDAAVDKII